MTLPYPFTRKIAAIQISFVFQCNARNSRREMLASPAALVIPSPSLTRAFEHQTATKQGFIRTTKKAATEVAALNIHLFALLYLAKPMARRSRMTVTRIWPG